MHRSSTGYHRLAAKTMLDMLTPQALAAGTSSTARSRRPLAQNRGARPTLTIPLTYCSAGPLVLETFLKHFLTPKKSRPTDTAREDLMYDEGEPTLALLDTATDTNPASAFVLMKVSLTQTA